MQAAILAIGDELILGKTADTNSAWLAARMVEFGVMPRYFKTLPDEVGPIAESIREAAQAADVVIATGGLGPTADDVSRQAFADALGCGLEEDTRSLARIEEFFRRRARPMPPANRCQALKPVSAGVLDNPAGTAPGLKAALGKATVYLLPGVPAEMKAMFELHIEPELSRASQRAIVCRVLRTFGMGESEVAERLGDIMRRGRNPLVGTTVSAGVVSVHVRAECAERAEAVALAEKDVAEIRRLLSRSVFGEDADTLESVVGAMLTRAGRTLAVAESCTGGLLAKLLTDVSGASAYFLGGWTVYSNETKVAALGVARAVLDAHGAVSEQAVRAMAENAARLSGADYALAVSGIAGPSGGSAEKPVGLVWIALYRSLKGGGAATAAERFLFPGGRDAVRERAARTALNMLRLQLEQDSIQ